MIPFKLTKNIKLENFDQSDSDSDYSDKITCYFFRSLKKESKI